MTIVLVKKDLPRVLRGGRLGDGSHNRDLINHACAASGVALCFVADAGSLTYLAGSIDEAHDEVVAGNPLLAKVKFPEFDTISKIAGCNEGTGLKSISRVHLWLEGIAQHPNPSPTLARLAEVVRGEFSENGFADDSIEICLNTFHCDVLVAFRKSIAAKDKKSPLSGVNALSNAIFKDNADVTESAKSYVLFHLEHGPRGAEGRKFRASDDLASVIDNGLVKIAKDLNVPPPVGLFTRGATEGLAGGRGTIALPVSNGNLVHLAAKA